VILCGFSWCHCFIVVTDSLYLEKQDKLAATLHALLRILLLEDSTLNAFLNVFSCFFSLY